MNSGWAPHGNGDPDALGFALGGGQRHMKPGTPGSTPSSCGMILGSPTTSVYRWLLEISSSPPALCWLLMGTIRGAQILGKS